MGKCWRTNNNCVHAVKESKYNMLRLFIWSYHETSEDLGEKNISLGEVYLDHINLMTTPLRRVWLVNVGSLTVYLLLLIANYILFDSELFYLENNLVPSNYIQTLSRARHTGFLCNL